MLNLPRWQVISIIAVTLLAALFALPNVLPGPVLDALPGWYSQSRINLVQCFLFERCQTQGQIAIKAIGPGVGHVNAVPWRIFRCVFR